MLSTGTMGTTRAMGPPGRKPDVMLKPAGLGSTPACRNAFLKLRSLQMEQIYQWKVLS